MAPLRLTRSWDALDALAASSQAGPRAAAPRVEPAPLVGTWVSFDGATGGIVRVVVAARGGGLAVRAFGAGPPAPRDWGEVPGVPFAGGVDGTAAVAFTASYDFGFLGTLLAAYLNRRLLVVDSYNVFRDGSGRSSYFARDHFYQPTESASCS
ncbi:MAG TPA: hypothetical protein VHQ90_18220 [Thermoanaerobaculia bacterium]|nr:hypothetical protein [Thermoanaerobaculia bacterium]